VLIADVVDKFDIPAVNAPAAKRIDHAWHQERKTSRQFGRILAKPGFVNQGRPMQGVYVP